VYDDTFFGWIAFVLFVHFPAFIVAIAGDIGFCDRLCAGTGCHNRTGCQKNHSRALDQGGFRNVHIIILQPDPTSILNEVDDRKLQRATG
jgi:hypothetical protein